jgi:cysteine-rich repeat protein
MTIARGWRLFGVLGLLGIAACGAPTAAPESRASELALVNCTFTQGYWKNHPSAWPVHTLVLGTQSYSEAQLLAILGTPVGGNGLIDLAHQLIAAKLNLAQGASGAALGGDIAAADALIGGLVVPPIGNGSLSTSSVSSLVDALNSFNSGLTGPGHCGNTPPAPFCGDGVVNQPTEQCDDGNNVSGDGCSATCQIEPPPSRCGDGIFNPATEQCDDGNNVNGDGCSSTCQVECGYTCVFDYTAMPQSICTLTPTTP